MARKLAANPESTVGLLTMATASQGTIDLRSTPCKDKQKLDARLSEVKLKGDLRFADAIRVAMLSLQNRANMRGESRIVAFVGSSIEPTFTEKKAKQLGEILRKEEINIDIVALQPGPGQEVRVVPLSFFFSQFLSLSLLLSLSLSFF